MGGHPGRTSLELWEGRLSPLQRERNPFHTLHTTLVFYYIPWTSYSFLANCTTLLCLTSRTLHLSISLFLCLPILNILSSHLSGDWYWSSTKGQVVLRAISHLSCLSLFLSAQLNPKGTMLSLLKFLDGVTSALFCGISLQFEIESVSCDFSLTGVDSSCQL